MWGHYNLSRWIEYASLKLLLMEETLHLGMYKLLQIMDKLPIKWCRILAINCIIIRAFEFHVSHGRLAPASSGIAKVCFTFRKSQNWVGGFLLSTLWFWGFWGSLAPELVGKNIIPGSICSICCAASLINSPLLVPPPDGTLSCTDHLISSHPGTPIR